MVADDVGDVVGLGERRYGDEGNAHAELIKVRAIDGIPAGGIGGRLRAELLNVLDAGVGGADGVGGTLRTAAGLLGGWRVAQVLALAGPSGFRAPFAGLAQRLVSWKEKT